MYFNKEQREKLGIASSVEELEVFCKKIGLPVYLVPLGYENEPEKCKRIENMAELAENAKSLFERAYWGYVIVNMSFPIPRGK